MQQYIINLVIAMVLVIFCIIMGFLIATWMEKRSNRKQTALIAQQPKPIEIIEYDEEAILKHLQFLIDESIDNYFLFNITAKSIPYINTEMENTMIEEVQKSVSAKISTALLNQLRLIYNDDYVGTAIGQHIYNLCVNRIVQFNVPQQ